MHSGYIAVIGRPSVGKSTMVNALIGRKVSIISKVYGTTRQRILGVAHGEDYQIIFLDTPGVQRPRDMLSQRMVRSAFRALSEADLALHVVALNERPGPEEAEIVARLKGPCWLVGNKLDQIETAQAEAAVGRYQDSFPYEKTFLVSALSGLGLDALRKALVAYLPEGPAYFPRDMVTDKPDEFLASELVREAVFAEVREEVPHAIAVRVVESRKEPTLWRLSMEILCARDSQKPILIGQGGSRLKSIGQNARLQIESIFGGHVFLQLWVKVQPAWRTRPGSLEELGYRDN